MSGVFDSQLTNVMSRALSRALDCLRSQGMVDGDAREASSELTQLIIQAASDGERDEESLAFLAVNRYAAQKGASGGNG